MSMKSRGQIDQLVSSIVVLILLVILMGLFVMLSSSFGVVNKVLSSGESSNVFNFDADAVGSRVLGDLFLTDYVTLKDKDGKDTTLSVRDAIVEMNEKRLAGEDYMAYSQVLENLFKKSYSCDDKNSLAIVNRYSADYSKLKGRTEIMVGQYWRYVDYPEEPIEKDGLSSVDLDFLENRAHIEGRASSELITQGYNGRHYTTLIRVGDYENIFIIIGKEVSC